MCGDERAEEVGGASQGSFVGYLTTLSESRLYSVGWCGDAWIKKNGAGFGGKQY
jgi:hypothetical protein